MKTIIFSALGIILGFLGLLLIIYIGIRIILNKCGFSDYSLTKLLKTIKEARDKEELRHKQVSGMTNVLLPTILNDFKDFNIKEFYNQTEEAIRVILDSIENKDESRIKDEKYDLIREKIISQIRDLQDTKVSYRYDDIIFHKHAIKSYQKQKGMVRLEISTALEYFYEKKINNKVVISSNNKKQTRYTTTFIYIYDTKKAGFDINVLGLNCPNCGSPISSLESKTCEYCKSGFNIEVAKLLKCWKIIDYKEDY